MYFQAIAVRLGPHRFPIGGLFFASGIILLVGAATMMFFGYASDRPRPGSARNSNDWVRVPRQDWERLSRRASTTAALTSLIPLVDAVGKPPMQADRRAVYSDSAETSGVRATQPRSGARASVSPVDDEEPVEMVSAPNDPLVQEMVGLIRELHTTLRARADWDETGIKTKPRPTIQNRISTPAESPSSYRAEEEQSGGPRTSPAIRPISFPRPMAELIRPASSDRRPERAQLSAPVGVASVVSPVVEHSPTQARSYVGNCVVCRKSIRAGPDQPRCASCGKPMCFACFQKAPEDRDGVVCPSCASAPGSLF